MACSKFDIKAYHLKELLLSFQKIRKSLKLDHQNSSYRTRANSMKPDINLLGGPLELSGPPLACPSGSDGVGVVSSLVGVASSKVGVTSSLTDEEVDTLVT